MTRSPPPTVPARPRDAATLIVVCPGDRGPLCLMGRRHADSEFLPGYFVFPGGAVEGADRVAKHASPLDLAHLGAMGVGGRSAAAATLGVAAVRETYEETGIMIAAPGDVGDAPGETFDEMRRRRVAPALGRLVYLGRAITPTCSPIRFHARFFLTRLQPGRFGLDGDDGLAGDGALEGGDRTGGGGALDGNDEAGGNDGPGRLDDLGGDDELHDLSWVPLADVASLPTIEVTRFMASFAGEIVGRSPRLPAGRPLFAVRGKHRLIRYL